MRLGDAISRLSRFSAPAVPELRYIESAVQAVHARWPDIDVPVNPREREKLALHFLDRVSMDDWGDTRLSFVIAAAQAVFDIERRERPDLELARLFLFDETRVSKSETFLSGMFSAYLESYVGRAPHTRAIAIALDTAHKRLSPSIQMLIEEVPEFLEAAEGPQQLAARMLRMADPFLELSRVGLRNPHGIGFMEQAHEALSLLVRPELTLRERIDWYIDWLRPPGRDARTIGAECAIEALTFPWLNTAPPDDIRSYLVDVLIEMYGDPRIRSGGIWAGVDQASMQVINRWLTREDMRFFTGVVDTAQKDAMWPPRRDFWLQLFDEKLIDAAWVAFSSQASGYARAHLMREEARNTDSRFGFQRARQNTSLLIMQIGNKVMVDGCHSYRTHVFDQNDPMAPKLFQEGYDCDEIMEAAPESKSHSSIDAWERWVRDMINADVKKSKKKKPYTKVMRPAAPTSLRAKPHQERRSPPRSNPPAQKNFDFLEASQPQKAAVPFGTLLTQGSSFPKSSPPQRAPEDGPQETGETPDSVEFLIRSGAAGVRAILLYLNQLGPIKMQSLLSKNARLGMEWLIWEKVPLPANLRNALAHLFSSMESSGHDPVRIISEAIAKPGVLAGFPSRNQLLSKAGIRASSSAEIAGISETADRKSVATPHTSQAEIHTDGSLPRLPEKAVQRIELLFQKVDEMEVFARERYVFSEDRTLGTALMKLKTRNPDLRPAEIHHLQQLYELMRRHAEKGRK